jgi:hypothetical protein
MIIFWLMMNSVAILYCIFLVLRLDWVSHTVFENAIKSDKKFKYYLASHCYLESDDLELQVEMLCTEKQKQMYRDAVALKRRLRGKKNAKQTD